MKIYKTEILLLLSCMILLTVSIAPAFAVSQATSTGPENTHSENEKILFAQADNYAKAFVAGDYKTIANMWAPDGIFTDIDGQVWRGRSAIEAYFKSSFECFGAQPIRIAVDSIKFLGDNIAIEEGHSRLLQGHAIDVVSHYMVVHLKVDNKWQMYAVTETPCPDAVIGSLKDWEWLIGDWSAKPSQSATVNLKAAWATGHNFIRCLFESESSVTGKKSSMVIIGRDPSNGQIISWHFDPSGGFGSGKWLKDGQTWIERARSVECNGITGSALYILHKLDGNTFTWRSTQRYLGNSQLPDGDELTISRNQTVNK